MLHLSRLRATPLALIAVLLAGCGASSCRVTGEVTYEGDPVKKGTITFVPVDGKGPIAGGSIVDGRYSAEVSTPGPKLARIEAVKDVPFARSSEEMARMHAERVARGDNSGLIDPADIIPPDATGNSTTVELNFGDQTLDFHLKRKPNSVIRNAK
jgi:hypothetical protein